MSIRLSRRSRRRRLPPVGRSSPRRGERTRSSTPLSSPSGRRRAAFSAIMRCSAACAGRICRRTGESTLCSTRGPRAASRDFISTIRARKRCSATALSPCRRRHRRRNRPQARSRRPRLRRRRRDASDGGDRKSPLDGHGGSPSAAAVLFIGAAVLGTLLIRSITRPVRKVKR